jgi:hypothetical protein
MSKPLAFAAGPAKPHFLNSDWLNKDLELVASLAKHIDKPYPKLDRFLSQVQGSDTKTHRWIGFELQQVKLAKYGGYTTAWITVVALHEEIVALEIIQSGTQDSWLYVYPQLQKAWKQHATENVEKASLTAVRFVEQGKIDHAIFAELGAPSLFEEAGACERQFELLLSPFDTLDVGKACYFDGVPPPGYSAVKQLINSGRFDLIRRVLRAPTPEARMYAVLSLYDRSDKTEDDKSVIEKLRKMDLPMRVCRGCRISTEKFDDIIQWWTKPGKENVI